MSKTKRGLQPVQQRENISLVASSTAVDPVLATLFTSSSGAVKIPAKSPGSAPSPSHVRKTNTLTVSTPKIEATNSTSESQSSDDSGSDEPSLDIEDRPRKRRRANQDDDLETTYLNKLVQEENREEQERKRQRTNASSNIVGEDEKEENDSVVSSDNDLADLSDVSVDSDDEVNAVPLHESLTKPKVDADKTSRTIFLSNVSNTAIKSKSARKTLLSHLKTALSSSSDSPDKIESIRFRSTAFDAKAGPKKAAYAKKELMDQTSHNTNAYVVLSSQSAAIKIARKLNGTQVLDRHIHIDAFAAPTKTDHKRCVFVGNLPFVDEEAPIEDETTGEKRKRSNAKIPADAEEGLWRTFNKCGKVESVRVVRDKETRIGKGFAYVQFENENGVEQALLLEGKKFPPLLPRLLRVSRAKRMQKKEVRERRGGRDGRGSARGTRGSGANSVKKAGGKLGDVVFEGYRASSAKGKMALGRTKKKKSAGGAKPSTRSSKRGAAFKAGGGKKNNK